MPNYRHYLTKYDEKPDGSTWAALYLRLVGEDGNEINIDGHKPHFFVIPSSMPANERGKFLEDVADNLKESFLGNSAPPRGVVQPIQAVLDARGR